MTLNELEKEAPIEYSFKKGEGSLGKHREKSKRVNESLGKLSLTEKQQIFLNFIIEHKQKAGFNPSQQDIADYFDITQQTVNDYIKALEKKGYLRVASGVHRGYEVIAANTIPMPDEANCKKIPLVGVIAAGIPILAEENIERYIDLPVPSTSSSKAIFALRVSGDSMKGIGIMDNDIAVLTQVEDVHSEVQTGNIVAALIDGDATLKTFIRSKDEIYLKPENSNYPKIPLAEKDFVSIMGKLISSHREY